MRPSATDRTRPRRVLAYSLAVGALLLGSAACESEDDPHQQLRDELGEEVGGERVEGNGYSIVAPDGWYDAKDVVGAVGGEQIDVALAAEPTSEFTTNLNVVRTTPTTATTLDRLAQKAASDAEALAETPVQVLDRIDLDGVAAVGQRYESSTGGIRHDVQQYVTAHDGSVYTITMSAGLEVADDASATLDQVVASWTWETPTT